MSIEELTAIIPPPETPTEVPDDPDWGSIEIELGVSLPEDYKAFVVTYGSGLLGNFIRIHNPFSASEYTALVPSVRRVSEIYREIKQSEGEDAVPFGIYPESPGLFVFGNDENGNFLFWLTEGEPDQWSCLIGEGRGADWDRYDMPMTTFLAKALKDEISSTVWPDDFPDQPDDFVFEPFRS